MSLEFDPEELPYLDQSTDEDFVDLTFRICDLNETDDFYRFQLLATHKDVVVGMKVMMVKGIQGGFDDEMNLIGEQVYRKGVVFHRSGEESDRLIAALGELYDLASAVAPRMIEAESFTAVALHQGSLDFHSDVVKLKLFGRDGEPIDEDDYYESFFNIDLSDRMVYWNEKDSDYRGSLLRGLSAC